MKIEIFVEIVSNKLLIS